MIYTLLLTSFLLVGCTYSGLGFTLDNSDNRKIIVEPTHVEISGDIESFTDYPELHKIMHIMNDNTRKKDAN